MSRIDIGQNIMQPRVVPATPQGFYQAADDPQTGHICAELEDALEQRRRGEISADEYKQLKTGRKRGCHFYTPHAHFQGGYKRSDGKPVDSQKAVIDLDGCEHFDLLYTQHLMGRERALGINMVNRSVSGTGGHVLFDIPHGLTRQQAQAWMAHQMGDVPYDKAVHELERAIYIPCRDYILYIDEELMFGDELHPALLSADELNHWRQEPVPHTQPAQIPPTVPSESTETRFPTQFKGIPYANIIRLYWLRTGGEPAEGERNDKLHRLAANLRAICDNQEEWLLELMPRYGLPETEMRTIIHSACKEPTRGSRLMDAIVRDAAPQPEEPDPNGTDDNPEDAAQADSSLSAPHIPLETFPQGVSDSIQAVGRPLAMTAVAAICPCIGALATGVRLDVHGQKRGLNLISYIVGDFASGKGQIDPVVEAWMGEVMALDQMYQQQEDEWRRKKRAAKNKEQQPEEPHLPVRCLTLNNTVANLAERLANTQGRHAFSFTPEADTVAQKWRQAMSDFSVMLRQSYDGSRYDREAKSADAVTVHIPKLLWNVTMCGTPDALYRVVSNYTDGFQSRIALARTPDNTFAPLEDNPPVLTPSQAERIRQVAHLLPLMQGDVELPLLEAQGRQWLERIRLETMKNDDTVRARQRFRVCVTAQRMACCLMLCQVCETLIRQHGIAEAEAQLKMNPELWKKLLPEAQTPDLLQAFDLLADSLLETALYFFRERIEAALRSRDYASGQRHNRGKNDSIYGRLDTLFTFEQAVQQTVAMKGAEATRNCVHQMLKNWRQQGLIEPTDDNRYRKKK